MDAKTPEKRTLELEVWSESPGGRIVKRKGIIFPELLVPDSFFHERLDTIRAISDAVLSGRVADAIRRLDEMAGEQQAWIALFEAGLKKYGDPRLIPGAGRGKSHADEGGPQQSSGPQPG